MLGFEFAERIDKTRLLMCLSEAADACEAVRIQIRDPRASAAAGSNGHIFAGYAGAFPRLLHVSLSGSRLWREAYVELRDTENVCDLPPVSVTLIDWPGGSVCIFDVNHLCLDLPGARRFVKLVFDLYASLHPTVEPRWSDYAREAWISGDDEDDVLALSDYEDDRLDEFFGEPAGLPRETIVRHLSSAEIADLRSISRKVGCTTISLLSARLHAKLIEISSATEIVYGFVHDLRRPPFASTTGMFSDFVLVRAPGIEPLERTALDIQRSLVGAVKRRTPLLTVSGHVDWLSERWKARLHPVRIVINYTNRLRLPEIPTDRLHTSSIPVPRRNQLPERHIGIDFEMAVNEAADACSITFTFKRAALTNEVVQGIAENVAGGR